MKVRLIGHTTVNPQTVIGLEDVQDLVAYCAPCLESLQSGQFRDIRETHQIPHQT